MHSAKTLPLRARVASVLIALGLSACGGNDDPPADASPATALPELAWSYQHTPKAHCGNGSETGFAINRAPASDTAMIYLQGGGACWEALTCLGVQTATHFNDTVQQETVLQEVADPRMAPLLDRALATNPFRAMTQVYVPYCTGDLHAGTRVNSYGLLGATREAHHVGALNMDAYLERLVPLLPGVKRVVLMGISGGGYGALLNWTRVRKAFGEGVRVDVIDDSGPPLEPVTEQLWTTMRDAWGLALPEGCADCAAGPSRWLPHYAATVPAPQRIALLAHQQDQVIGQYLALSDSAQAQGLDALRASAGERQKLYVIAGNDHTLLDDQPRPVTSTGVGLDAWLQQFLDDDPAWAHQGP